jgi:hypothetical protein
MTPDNNFFSKRPAHFGMVAMIALFTLAVGCSDDREVGSSSTGTFLSSSTDNAAPNAKSTSSAGDYNIALTVNGTIWTYVITKNPGAKDLSHFVLNFQNCGANSATISNILWATVNGQPATLESTEGNTGCNVEAVTTNYVKFDDLASASSYTIVFEVDRLFGNFVGTTAWLKAGTSCFAYSVLAPCCPLN